MCLLLVSRLVACLTQHTFGEIKHLFCFVCFQNITYYSYRGRFTETIVLVTIHKGSISPRGKQTWHGELLSIPSVPPSHLRGCKIIDCQYILEVSLLISAEHLNSGQLCWQKAKTGCAWAILVPQ